MEGKVSFSVLEKEFMHVIRSGINNSEDKIDLENHFSNTMKTLLNRIFEHERIPVEIDDNDVTFNPGARNYFTISGELLQLKDFKNLWEGTDLASVIGRFADLTHKKYLHLDKHREKTRFKIRNVV
jgi:hypothetical protein